MLADQVDGRHERLCLDRQKAGRSVEVVAVWLRIDLDLALLLVDLRIQHVGAAAEVDDVQDVHVLAELLLAELQSLADLLHRHALARAAGPYEDARERDQAREALGPDRRLAPAGRRFLTLSTCRGRSATAGAAAGGHGRALRSAGDCSGPGISTGELRAVTLMEQLQPSLE